MGGLLKEILALDQMVFIKMRLYEYEIEGLLARFYLNIYNLIEHLN